MKKHWILALLPGLMLFGNAAHALGLGDIEVGIGGLVPTHIGLNNGPAKVLRRHGRIGGRIGADHVLANVFGVGADDVLRQVGQVHIVACGTSYHAGLVARYQLEELAGIPETIEFALPKELRIALQG